MKRKASQEAYVVLTQAVQLNTKDELSLYNFALVCLQTDRKDELAIARSKLEMMNSPYLAQLDVAMQQKKPATKR